MPDSEAYRKGSEMRRKLLGDAYVENANKTTYTDPMMRKFIDTATENIFGNLWTRPGHDLKTRAMIVVISDAAYAALVFEGKPLSFLATPGAKGVGRNLPHLYVNHGFFAKNPRVRLNFFYERSPYFINQKVGVYPVGRITERMTTSK